MAVFDTYRAFQALTAAGFSERQARALIDVGSEGYGALATKEDIAGMATKADVRALEQATKADVQALRQATKVDFREFELRLRLHVGAYLAIAAAWIVMILGFLSALFTGQFE